MKKNIIIIINLLILTNSIFAKNHKYEFINELNSYTNLKVKKIREDVRKSIYIIKSKRPVNLLPELKFYKYKIKKNDTFWKIISKTSLNIDTLMSVNFLSTPKDIIPGKIIFIPNMRGVILKKTDEKKIIKTCKKNKILSKYIFKINNIKNFSQSKKKHIFIPCGRLSNLERSLFIGTGFIYPIKNGGKRSSGFGSRKNPFNGKYYEFHRGIDIACKMRSRVIAARAGQVVFTGYKGGYGKLVIIKHEHGYHSFYGHLSSYRVKRGQKVKLGEIIAYSGNTGRTTGPHLHFEVQKGKTSINPGVLLKLYKH